jgi:hypothetical protein
MARARTSACSESQMSDVSERTGTPIKKKKTPKIDCGGSREMTTVPSPSDVFFSTRPEPEKMK